MLVHMPEVITTKNSLPHLLLSIHFYEKGGNVEFGADCTNYFPLLIIL
jgi:hypothetical protein